MTLTTMRTTRRPHTHWTDWFPAAAGQLAGAHGSVGVEAIAVRCVKVTGSRFPRRPGAFRKDASSVRDLA